MATNENSSMTVAPSEAAAAEMAVSAGLVYVNDQMPGLRRIRKGDGFVFVNSSGDPVTKESELRRIASLAIPPAYEDVWICAHAFGHLQATGRDARMRKQYRYHAKWRTVRDQAKFDRMIGFAAALPKLRRVLRRDLAKKALPRSKVLAVVVSLLDATLVRVGNPEYARDNNSFGLTTLRNRHATFLRGGAMSLRFRGKGGKEHEISVSDKRLVRLVRRCHELPGQELFQYRDETGNRRPIGSDQVNAYLKEAMGDDFTAKDFRTWGATLRAIELLKSAPWPDPRTDAAIKASIVATVKAVAAELGNTPAVCRKSYINPVVFDRWTDGSLHAFQRRKTGASRRITERAVIEFLRNASVCGSSARPARPVRGLAAMPARQSHAEAAPV